MALLQSPIYSRLASEEFADGENEKSTSAKRSYSFVRRYLRVTLICDLLCSAVIIITKGVLVFRTIDSSSTSPCNSPVVRLEWRSVDKEARTEYLAAVQCLHETPSSLDFEGKVSDDFPWAHDHIANSGG